MGARRCLQTPRRAAVVLAMAVGSSACAQPSATRTGTPSSAPPPSESPPTTSPSEPASLRITEVTTPPLQVPFYTTAGTFPQVGGGIASTDLTAVNSALRNAILEDQNQYAALARQNEAQQEAAGKPQSAEIADPGRYETESDPELISASTAVVSAMIPVLKLFPGGTSGSVWLSVTAQVPSGTVVSITDLFSNPQTGLEALSSETRMRIQSSGKCGITAGLTGSDLTTFLHGSNPTADNYKFFALTVGGLAVGFSIGQVAAVGCGRVEVTVPYDTLRPYFSPIGQSLVAGVKKPEPSS